MKDKLIRPPLLEEGTYWIGHFMVQVHSDVISIQPRQAFSHGHEYIDEMAISRFNKDYCQLHIVPQKDSPKAEKRIQDILKSKEWKPRKFKSK